MFFNSVPGFVVHNPSFPQVVDVFLVGDQYLPRRFLTAFVRFEVIDKRRCIAHKKGARMEELPLASLNRED